MSEIDTKTKEEMLKELAELEKEIEKEREASESYKIDDYHKSTELAYLLFRTEKWGSNDTENEERILLNIYTTEFERGLLENNPFQSFFQLLKIISGYKGEYTYLRFPEYGEKRNDYEHFLIEKDNLYVNFASDIQNLKESIPFKIYDEENIVKHKVQMSWGRYHRGDFTLIPIIDENGKKQIYFNNTNLELKQEEIDGKFSRYGTFEVDTNEIMVSDPCYSVGTWCQVKLEGVKNGTWEGETLNKILKRGTYSMIWYLRAFHADHYVEFDKDYKEYEIVDGEAGVDAGLMSIFNYEAYVKYRKETDDTDDKWQEFLETLPKEEGEQHHWYKNIGVVSSSGFGDGGGPVRIRKVNNEIVDVIVEFVREEEEE